jgi:hypothetical protein
VNVGRGRHVVDEDLIAALDSGQLSYAALDALWPEPLPPTSPLWLHPKVTVMPHVARRPTVAQLVTEMTASIRSFEAGRGLLQVVDIAMGYSHVRHFKQQAQKIFACLFKRFSMAATGQSRRHDHETTVDHALIRGLVTAGPVIRRGASSV